MSGPIPPVGDEDLARLRELSQARANLADRDLSLDLEKIQILAAARRVTEEQAALFRRLASDRGLPDDVVMDVNPRTGEIAVESSLVQAAEQPSD